MPWWKSFRKCRKILPALCLGAKCMETQSGAQVYEFGGFSLDMRQRLLSCEGKIIALPPKTIHLLVVLVQNHGRLVEKDELLNSVWPDTVVEESALAKGIHLLRKTLGESVIVTFPKRGYRFAAPLIEVGADTLVPLPTDKPTAEPVLAEMEALPVRRKSVPIVWIAVPAVVLISLALYTRLLSNRPARIVSVAVLPFQSALGQDPLLAAGFTQDLTARLRTLPGLRVVRHFLLRTSTKSGLSSALKPF